MRNLLLFITRYHLFFVFLLLEGIAFYFYIQNNYYQRAVSINSANYVTGQFYQRVSDVKEYFQLRDINDKLAEENARLRNMLKESQYVDTSTFKLKEDTTLHQRYTYMDADVIRNSVNLKNNFITLNRGRKHGVEENMGVISSNGIVGHVSMVSENFCTVVSLLNPNSKIPPKIEGNDYFGTLTWDGKDPRYGIVEEINMHAPIKKGQRVVTSGYSNFFPENIPVGIIEDFYVPPGDNFYKIKVHLFTNFETLRKVYIVKDLMQNEQDSLERKSYLEGQPTTH